MRVTEYILIFAGLLLSICTNFYENWVISSESFLTWESSTDPAEQGGKGECFSYKVFCTPKIIFKLIMLINNGVCAIEILQGRIR